MTIHVKSLEQFLAYSKCHRNVTYFLKLLIVFVFYIPVVRTVLGMCINVSGLSEANSGRVRNGVFRQRHRLGMESAYDPICIPGLLNISFSKSWFT